MQPKMTIDPSQFWNYGLTKLRTLHPLDFVCMFIVPFVKVLVQSLRLYVFVFRLASQVC